MLTRYFLAENTLQLCDEGSYFLPIFWSGETEAQNVSHLSKSSLASCKPRLSSIRHNPLPSSLPLSRGDMDQQPPPCAWGPCDRRKCALGLSKG